MEEYIIRFEDFKSLERRLAEDGGTISRKFSVIPAVSAFLPAGIAQKLVSEGYVLERVNEVRALYQGQSQPPR